MKTSTFSVAMCLASLALISSVSIAEESPRATIDLTGMWKSSEFLKGDTPIKEGIQKGFSKQDFDDSGWKDSPVPDNWFRTSGYGEASGSTGNLLDKVYAEKWYRKEVDIPKKYSAGRVLVRFEGSSFETWLWVNGQPAGYHFGEFAPFEFDITKYVKFGEKNLLAIRCSVDRDLKRHSYLMRGGMYQPVTLSFVPRIYTKRICIDPDISTSSIQVRALIYNGTKAPANVEIEGAVRPWNQDTLNATERTGPIVLKPGINNVRWKIKLRDPVSWSPENPYLYALTTTLRQNGTILDEKTDRFGFRQLLAKGNHLLLNGKRIRLFGGGSFGPSGVNNRWGTANLPPHKEKKRVVGDFRNAKAKLGLNFVRAHSAYTPPGLVLEAADEAGMMFYNQFSFFAGKRKLQGKYLDLLIAEMKEWIYANYNRPSLVMFTFTNEIFSSDAREATRIYDELKKEFGDRLLLTPSSGGSIYNTAKKVKTDVIDFHNYTGMPFSQEGMLEKRSWRFMGDTITKLYDEAKPICGEKPLIITEFPSSGRAALWIGTGKRFLHNGKVTPESYVAISTPPAGQYSPAFYDLKNASLRDLLHSLARWPAIKTKLNKRAVESLRRLDFVQGVEPNCTMLNLPPVLGMVYQPRFVCADVFNTNLFSGDTLTLRLHVINDLPEPQKSVKVVVDVLGKNGARVLTGKLQVGDMKGFSRKILPYEIKIPSDFPTGSYDIKLYLHVAGKKVSDNFYDVYILNRDDLKKPITTKKKILVLDVPKSNGGVEDTKKILASVGLSFETVSLSDGLKTFVNKLTPADILIIPAFYNPGVRSWRDLDERWEIVGKAIRQWVENGGRVLSFEQCISDSLPWAPEWEIFDAQNCWFFDMAVPEHPVYTGMKQRQFDSWNLGKNMTEQTYAIRSITVNVVSCVAATSNDQMTMAAAEGRLGKGSIFASQFAASRRYMNDSVATKYLRNLLSYVLQDTLYEDVRPLVAEQVSRTKKNYRLDLDKCVNVDLRKHANMGFRDDIDNDGKGGWTDQGVNDLRHIPVGGAPHPEKEYWEAIYKRKFKDKQVFLGVPFDIIDPAKNSGKSCIVLAGHPRPQFPKEVKDIPVNSKVSSLFFLHTGVWCIQAGPILKYRVHYSDGTTKTIPILGSKQISDWWGPRDLSDARVAWAGRNPASRQKVGVYMYEWKNPTPGKVVTSIDVVSTRAAVPVLLAITYTQPTQAEIKAAELKKAPQARRNAPTKHFPQRPLLYDDFSSVERSKKLWRLGASEQYEFENGLLRLKAMKKGYFVSLWTGDGTWTDYILDVRMRLLASPADSNGLCIAGISVRNAPTPKKGESKYLKIFLAGRTKPTLNYELFIHRPAWNKKLLNQGRLAKIDFSDEKWHYFRLVCLGDTITVWVDGEKMGTIGGVTSSGGVGLFAMNGCVVEYDDVHVIKISASTRRRTG